MKYTVCLIDDDNIYQFAASRTLETTGLIKKIHSFYTGAEALTYFKSAVSAPPDDFPDIIFLDINMPETDGWEFLEAYEPLAEQLSRRVPLYMVSSSISEADIARSRSIPLIMDYLIKPVGKQQYHQLLESLELRQNQSTTH